MNKNTKNTDKAINKYTHFDAENMHKKKINYNPSIYLNNKEGELKSNNRLINSLYAEYQFILCVNCNQQIYIENINDHSEECFNVKEEVKDKEYSPLLNITFKLGKLKEHIENLGSFQKRSNQDHKEIENIKELLTEILDHSNVNYSSITNTKKNLIQLDEKIAKFASSFYILILLERVRILLIEKNRILKYLLSNPKNDKSINKTIQSTNDKNNPEKYFLKKITRTKKIKSNYHSTENNPKLSPLFEISPVHLNSIDSIFDKQSQNFTLSSISQTEKNTSSSTISIRKNENSYLDSKSDSENIEIQKIKKNIDFDKDSKKSKKFIQKGIWNEMVLKQITSKSEYFSESKLPPNHSYKRSQPLIDCLNKKLDMSIITEDINENKIFS